MSPNRPFRPSAFGFLFEIRNREEIDVNEQDNDYLPSVEEGESDR